jgi:hypothetical protein
MRSDQKIQINGLLLQREELFVRIHDLEKSAAALFGGPYPFTRPSLPSDARNKGKSSSARAAVRDPLRKLEGLETAYRVTYRRFNQIVIEDHDDLEALRTLLAAQGKNLAVTRLETIDLGGRAKAVLI